jgi:hypothetical protein
MSMVATIAPPAQVAANFLKCDLFIQPPWYVARIGSTRAVIGYYAMKGVSGEEPFHIFRWKTIGKQGIPINYIWNELREFVRFSGGRG